MRSVPSEDFGSLQLVIVGAEKLPGRLADAVEQYFGLRPLEGYGTTECAPVVAVNIDGFSRGGLSSDRRQARENRARPARHGGARWPTRKIRGAEKIATGEPGMLLVRGPNVMRGYLGLPEKTADVLSSTPSSLETKSPGRRFHPAATSQPLVLHRRRGDAG